MNKKLKRYHKDVFLPSWTEELLSNFINEVYSKGPLTFSGHAVEKIVESAFEHGKNLFKYLIKILREGRLNLGDVFEFYSRDAAIKKACFRFTFSDYPVDLVLVISSDGVVITVYAINKEDNHSTLNQELYERS